MRTRMIVGLAAMGGLLLAGCSTANVADLGVGDCFNVSLTNEVQEIAQVPTVDCSKEHTAEVFRVADIVAGSSFDEEEIAYEAFEMCFDAFEVYVGSDYFDPRVDDLDFSFFYPLQADWEAGDRSITCVLVPVDPTQKLTGSMKDAFAEG